jgi:hypothetical protein
MKVDLDRVYAAEAPDLQRVFPMTEELLPMVGESAAALRADGSFDDVSTARFQHEVTYSTAAWLDVLPTHSDHRLLGPERLGRLLARVGGVVDRHGGSFVVRYDTWLVTATRR